ncbi:MAG: DUF3618 domain-containing protein [Jatrophihabitantaceae bacterium]|nr:DUF3618 domain-containing protein [Chloroflexota bacterium]
MAGERSVDEIQRDIENARTSLAVAVDQLIFQTNPKRIANNAKQAVKDKAQTPQGKAVIGGAGALAALLVIRRIAKRKS